MRAAYARCARCELRGMHVQKGARAKHGVQNGHAHAPSNGLDDVGAAAATGFFAMAALFDDLAVPCAANW